MAVLVTGGAGYIGGHMNLGLLDAGEKVVALDNLSTGFAWAVPETAKLVVGDFGNSELVARLIHEHEVDAIAHFAAKIVVPESDVDPLGYYLNNTAKALNLIQCAVNGGVKNFIFSSTAAVYGTPHASPILETFPIAPVNPYGESKVMAETLFRWFDTIHGLRTIALRYFNASGADPAGGLGEEHDPETHLIPLMLRAVVAGKPFTVFGNDYATPDGTCIRDYIHVNDLAEAHILALEALLAGAPSDQFNAGAGTGHSVLEMIRGVEETTGRQVPYQFGPRREGDPPALVANTDKLRRVLGWSPKYPGIREIIASAWQFEERRA